MSRILNTTDSFIKEFDTAFKTVFGGSRATRENPAAIAAPTELTTSEQELSGRLMRVNHCGEVCAQALYLGQSVTARRDQTKNTMKQAAIEEIDHLAWCETRLHELGTHKSYLDPFFFAASFAAGAVSGLLGDKFNLGFVAATEAQVVQHLEEHIDKLPESDHRSRAILEQMKSDEERHRTTALQKGGIDFPGPLKKMMTNVSKVMTRSTYWI